MLPRRSPLPSSAVTDAHASLLLLLHVGIVVLGGSLVVAPLGAAVDLLGCLVVLLGARLVSHDLVSEIGGPTRSSASRRTHVA